MVLDLDESCAKVAEHVLDRVVRRGTPDDRLRLSMQYSTREVFPDHPDDVLRIDATSLYRPGVDCSERSRLLLRGLTSVKKAIANASGRPRLSIHGSKHLSAAFAFGRVFAPFSMDIRQTPDSVWRTDVRLPDRSSLISDSQRSGFDSASAVCGSGCRATKTSMRGLMLSSPQPRNVRRCD